MNELDALAAPKKKARVEIIPLIDVVFFLLATFVLFTLSLQKNKVLETNLPTGGINPEGGEDTLFVQASAGGTYYFKRGTSGTAEMVVSAELRDRLIGYRDSVGAPRVFIRSDTQAKFGDAVRVLDEVRRAGISQVAVETMATRTGS